MGKKKKAKKALAKAMKLFRRNGLTKGQTVVAILGLYAERGRLGPNMLRFHERLAREEGMFLG